LEGVAGPAVTDSVGRRLGDENREDVTALLADRAGGQLSVQQTAKPGHRGRHPRYRKHGTRHRLATLTSLRTRFGVGVPTKRRSKPGEIGPTRGSGPAWVRIDRCTHIGPRWTACAGWRSARSSSSMA